MLRSGLFLLVLMFELISKFSMLIIVEGTESSFFWIIVEYSNCDDFWNLIESMNFDMWKISRKSRSKVVWTSSSCSGDRKVKSETTVKVSPTSFSGEATSCLSTTSSSRSLRYAHRASKCRSVIDAEIKRETPQAAKLRVKNPAGTPHLRRRGDAILMFLSHGGWSSEVKIREMLGDSPDTSKALRMWYSLSIYIYRYICTHIQTID